MANTSLEGFGDAFALIVDEYSKELEEQVKKDVRESAKVARKELKTTTPEGAGRYHDWKEYQEGWGFETKKDHYGGYSVIVKNRTKPGLTHLLEKGHINRDGKTRAKALPHISPAAEKAFEELEKRIHE